jgi:hypothetical protein
MLLPATLAVLAAWLAFVWLFDPDGFREARRKHTERSRAHAGHRHVTE